MGIQQASLELLTSSDPPASASHSAGIMHMSHCAWPSLGFKNCHFSISSHDKARDSDNPFIRHPIHHLHTNDNQRQGFIVGQVGLKLLTSGDPPTSASQSAGII
ncbi:hypothetical protein AAY473_001384, partial [Plecturocebus cupreus]